MATRTFTIRGNITQHVEEAISDVTFDGIETDFTLSHSPTSTPTVWFNGIRQTVTNDFTYTGSTLTMVLPPDPLDQISVEYRK